MPTGLTKRLSVLLLSALILALVAIPQKARCEELKGFDLQVYEWAKECREEVTEQMQLLLKSGRLNKSKLFDTFYIPIPNTDPQKYTTKYDRFLDETIREILDRYLAHDKRMAFVVAVDVNGYLPTHNTRYSQPLTGDAAVDVQKNRTKRIFNDRTGLAAAKNTEPFLLQKYSRDTGEMMADLSVPIYIDQKHWGAVRIGYKVF